VSYETEEQQVEALKAWWAENGRAVILGIGLGIVIIGGYYFWEDRKEKAAMAASTLYNDSITALRAGDTDTAQAKAKEVSEEYGSALYASYARFSAARAAIEAGEMDAAAEHLQWVAKESDHAEVKLIAQIRLARVKGELGDAAGGLSTLPKSVPDSFVGIVEEVRGDLHVLAGDGSAARQAYEAARASGTATNSQMLDVKLNDLAEPADAS